MARYSRSRSDSSFIVLIIIAVTAWVYRTYIIYALLGLTVFMVLFSVLRIFRHLRLRHISATLADVDAMDGIDFERYIADLLKKKGFSNIKLTEKYDLGIDIIAQKDGQTWGIQVKRYSGLVKASAVRQVVTALNFYNCNRSMVITNSRYSTVAKKLALTNDCVLIDRSKLLKLMA